MFPSRVLNPEPWHGADVWLKLVTPLYGLKGEEGSCHKDDGVAAPRAMAVSCKRSPSENMMPQRKSALLCMILCTCKDINTIVKSKELAQFTYVFLVPASTGTQATINKSTYKAHMQYMNSSIDPLCVWWRGEQLKPYTLHHLFINPWQLFMLTPPPNAKMAVTNPKWVRPP